MAAWVVSAWVVSVCAEALSDGPGSGVESGVDSGVDSGVASEEGSMAAALEVEVSRAKPIAPPMSRLTESSATMATGVLRSSRDKCGETEPRENKDGKSTGQS